MDFKLDDEKYEKEKEMLLNAYQTILMSTDHPSIFHDLNRILMEAITLNYPTVLLGDMPELLNRM